MQKENIIILTIFILLIISMFSYAIYSSIKTKECLKDNAITRCELKNYNYLINDRNSYTCLTQGLNQDEIIFEFDEVTKVVCERSLSMT